VPDPAPSSPGSPATHEATVASLAQKIQTPTNVARRLYDQEMAVRPSKTRVKKFISIITARHAKNHLNASEGKRAPSMQVKLSPRRSRSLLRRRERSAAEASELRRRLVLVYPPRFQQESGF
jgi:hypothetical protein